MSSAINVPAAAAVAVAGALADVPTPLTLICLLPLLLAGAGLRGVWQQLLGQAVRARVRIGAHRPPSRTAARHTRNHLFVRPLSGLRR